MASNKQQAVGGAKDAALNSISIVITGTAKEASQLRSAAVNAARGAVAVRKSASLVAAKFATLTKQISQIKDAVNGGGDASSKLVRIGGILSSGGDAYKQKEAQLEEGPGVAATATAAVNATGKAALSLGALALAIPFLLSPEVREAILGFFDGFLKGLGIGKEAMSTAKFVLGATVAVLGTYFTLKALAPVADAWNKMKELAEVLGLAGEKVATEKNQIDADKASLKKGADVAKEGTDEINDTIKKGKKVKGNFVSKIMDKFKLLKGVIGPKLLSLGKNILKAIPFLGTLVSIGFIISDIWDIGSAIYDMFAGDDDKEEGVKQESAPAPAGTPAAAPAAPPPAAPEAKPAAAAASAPSSPPPPPAASSALPEVNVSAASTGQAVDVASVSVQQADVDAFKTQGNINVINMKNATIVVDAKADKPAPSQPAIFSTTVGT